MLSTTLVTGASSGIGFEIVKRLAADHLVFAGVRRKQDGIEVEKLGPNVKAVILDVTDRKQLEAAFEKIEAAHNSDRPFHLVNNAGIAVSAPIEGVALDALREQFEVNVFGAISACQVFSPLLRKNRGRIVMIGSISGLISAPFLGVYSASKFALEAITSSLRMEMAPFGVSVFMIRPGQVETPIWEKNFAKAADIISELPKDVRSRYEGYLKKFVAVVKADISHAIPASNVADAVADCIESRSPRATRIVASKLTRLGVLGGLRVPLALLEKSLSKRYHLS